MKKPNTKQLLTTLDLPPVIPASIPTLDFEHAVNSYQPGTYKPEDLPDKIPIINESTGSFRRFIRRAKSRRVRKNDRRRIVSAPPGTYTEKELPGIPSSVPTSPIASTGITIIPENTTTSKPLFTQAHKTVSFINENIHYPMLTTPNYNPHQIVIIEEPHLKLEPKLTNDSETNSIGTDSILSTKSIDVPVVIHDDNNEVKEMIIHNSDNDSLVDSLFSEKEKRGEEDQIDPVTSHEEHEMDPSMLVLPKMRKKSPNKGVSLAKLNSHQVNSNSLGYCLDTPNVYKESRFPLVPSHIKIPKQMNECANNDSTNTNEKQKTDNRRSLSDFTHMKHASTKSDYQDNNNVQEKHRSLISFSQLKLLGSKEEINKKSDKKSDKRRSWVVDFIHHGNTNRESIKQQKHRSISNIVVSKTKQPEPVTITTVPDKYNRKTRLSYSDFIRPQVRSISTPDVTRINKTLPPLPQNNIHDNNIKQTNAVEPSSYYNDTFIKPRRNKYTNINTAPITSTSHINNHSYPSKPTTGKSLPPIPPPSPPKINGEYYRTNRFGDRSYYVASM